jgi:hypothetical protein
VPPVVKSGQAHFYYCDLTEIGKVWNLDSDRDFDADPDPDFDFDFDKTIYMRLPWMCNGFGLTKQAVLHSITHGTPMIIAGMASAEAFSLYNVAIA